ncbi:hypothetical protein F7725_016181 [Dissostichus mawsoni]|uniref:Uncharacterized protein n=1 Tax=Dissostichus mawsoni TaxID=36200 RepID=A0A7J5Y4T3_DISMA|nr:hypothetical protein F7725_016181 [Dissostichus mawsoni]
MSAKRMLTGSMRFMLNGRKMICPRGMEVFLQFSPPPSSSPCFINSSATRRGITEWIIRSFKAFSTSKSLPCMIAWPTLRKVLRERTSDMMNRWMPMTWAHKWSRALAGPSQRRVSPSQSEPEPSNPVPHPVES